MFDTNVYNNLLHAQNDFIVLPFAEYYCTFQQYDELLATPLVSRKEELRALFLRLERIELPVETFILGNARLDKTKLGDGKVFFQIKTFLDGCKKKKNNLQDALIAETAAVNSLILITDDDCLFKACVRYGIDVRHLSDLM